MKVRVNDPISLAIVRLKLEGVAFKLVQRHEYKGTSWPLEGDRALLVLRTADVSKTSQTHKTSYITQDGIEHDFPAATLSTFNFSQLMLDAFYLAHESEIAIKINLDISKLVDELDSVADNLEKYGLKRMGDLTLSCRFGD